MQRVNALDRQVHVCEPVKFDLPDAHRAFDILRAEGFLAQMGNPNPQELAELSPNVRENMKLAQTMTLNDRAWAHLAQTRLMRQFAKIFDQYDIIVSPTTPVTPFPWTTWYAKAIDGHPMRTYYEWLALTYVVTLSTHPALSLPMGLDEAQMPFGLQLIGPMYQDGRLLAIARSIEEAFAMDPLLSRPKATLSPLTQAREELRSSVTHPPQI